MAGLIVLRRRSDSSLIPPPRTVDTDGLLFLGRWIPMDSSSDSGYRSIVRGGIHWCPPSEEEKSIGIHRLRRNPAVSTVQGGGVYWYPPSKEGESFGIHCASNNPSVSSVRGGGVHTDGLPLLRRLIPIDSPSLDSGYHWIPPRMVDADGLLLLEQWIPMDFSSDGGY